MVAILILCVSWLATSAHGQELTSGRFMRPHPLLSLLALTPDEPFAVRGTPFLRYTDFSAIRRLPARASDCSGNAAFDPAALYAPPGIDPRQIERALLFGDPPANGLILEGDFEPEALAHALHASGYTQRDEQGILLLQPEPDAGNSGDRRDSVALAGRYLLRTPKPSLLDELVNAYIGYRQSLFTRPGVLVLAQELSRRTGDMLRAAVFFAGALPPGLPKLATTEGDGNGLVALAQYRDGAAWMTALALVYDARDSARVAARMLADELENRMRHHTALWIEAPVVYEDSSGDYFVALARVRHQDDVCVIGADWLIEETPR